MINLEPTKSETTAVIRVFPTAALNTPSIIGILAYNENVSIIFFIYSSERLILVGTTLPKLLTINGFPGPAHSIAVMVLSLIRESILIKLNPCGRGWGIGEIDAISGF